MCFFTSLGTLFFFFSPPAGSTFVPESSIISENISSVLRRATHPVWAGGRQRGGMWVSSVSRQHPVCWSPDLGGGEDRRREEEAHPSPHITTPLILLHRQIRVRRKIERLCACVCVTLMRSRLVFKLLHVSVHMRVCACLLGSVQYAKL